MKNKKICILVILVLTMTLFSGCSNGIENKSEQNGSMEDENLAIISAEELSNTYTTRFSDVNQITAPTFTFSYPDGWSIESETVDPTSEEVILSNPSGVTITYWNFGGMRDLTGPTREINEVTVEQVADASFPAQFRPRTIQT